MKKVNDDDLLGPDPMEQEPSINELLNAEGPKTRFFPSINQKIMVSFLRKSDGKRITAPGTEYWVVKDEDGKLHYKEVSQVIFLPFDWKDGDPINF